MKGGMVQAGAYLAILVIVSAVSIGFLANSILPLAIATADLDLYVKRSDTSQAIPNALCEFYQYNILGIPSSTPSYSVYTNSAGLGERVIAQGRYDVRVSANGFTPKTVYIDIRSGNVEMWATYTFLLDPTGTPPPTGETVTFYVVNADHYGLPAQVTFNGETKTSDQSGKAIFYSVPTGSRSCRVFGGYPGPNMSWITFDFTQSVTVGGLNVFTAHIPELNIIAESPPPPGSGGGPWWEDPMEWLMGSLIAGVPNWVLVGAAFLLLSRR